MAASEAIFTDAKYAIYVHIIGDFSKDDTFIVIFTSSKSNDRGDQISSLPSAVFPNSAYRVE
jgi:hypothetical protein